MRNFGWSYIKNVFRHYRRRRSVLKKMTERVNAEGGTWYHAAGGDRQVAAEAVRIHIRTVASEPEKLIKNDRKRRVSCVQVKGRPYIVKEFVNPGIRGPFSMDRRSWANSFLMVSYGFKVCRCYAWFRSFKASFVVMEYIDGRLLEAVLAETLSGEQKTLLLSKTAEFAARLHRAGIYHRDLYPHNWIVGKEDDIHLIDLEDIDLKKVIDEKVRIRFFSQLFSETEIADSMQGRVLDAYDVERLKNLDI